MDLITQRKQQASPGGSANHVCEIWSEIKDMKYNKVPWTETVIKLIFCKKMGEGANTLIFFVTNEQCEIWSEIKDIKYSKVPWTETVIKLNFCKTMGEGASTSIFFVTNEQLSCTFNADIVIVYLKTELC
jgi:hypothetical protein